MENFFIIDVARLPDHRHENECIGCFSAQAPDRIANLRRSCIFHIAKAHQRDILCIQTENARHRQRIGLLGSSADPLPCNELSQDKRDCFVKQTRARNAQNWCFGPPSFRQFFHPSAERRFCLVDLRERHLLVGFRIGLRRWLGLILMPGEIVDKFGDGVANVQHAFVVERPAFGIGLCQFQTFDEDLLVVRQKWLLLQVLLRLLGCLDRVPR